MNRDLAAQQEQTQATTRTNAVAIESESKEDASVETDAPLHERQDVWPLIEAFRRGDKFVVQADLPGVSAEEVSVELTEDEVIISGERRRAARENDQTYRQERNFGPFRRGFRLPDGVPAESGRASLGRGVLSIEFETKRDVSPSSATRRVDVRGGRLN